jgi:O-antigen/teichoic acid export membrane protein
MFWRGVLGYLPVNLVQGLVGVLNIIVFTRLLSPSEFGVYALAFSVMTLVHTLVFTWLEAAMARFYAREAGAGGHADHFAAIYRSFAGLALVLPVLAIPCLWLWPASPSLKLAVAAGLGSILFRSLCKLVQEHRRAAGDVRVAAVLDMAQTAGGFLIGAGLALWGLGGGAPLAGAGIAAAVCLAFTLPAELKQSRGGAVQRQRVVSYAVYGVPIALSMILSLALATTDRFFLAHYLDAASVGVYHAGYSLSNRTLDVLFIWLGMAGGPAAVAAYERGGAPALQRAAREQIDLMLLIGLPAAVGLALVARPLAALMIGGGLAEGAAYVTPFVAFSGLLSGLTTYYFLQAFTLACRTGLLFAAMAVPAGANLILNLILVPRMGLDGALWATAISYSLGLAAFILLGRRALPLPLPWATFGRCGLAAAGMAAAVLMVPAFGGIIELVAKAMAGAAVYGLLAVALDAAGARGHARQAIALVMARAARIA